MTKIEYDDAAPSFYLARYLCSVLAALVPTHKHGDTATKNVEFSTLLLDQVTALLAKRLARTTSFLLMMSVLVAACVVAFLQFHE